MNHSFFNGIAMLVLAAVIIGATVFFTTADDALRSQVERVLVENRSISERLDRIEDRLGSRPVVAATAATAVADNIANREFFVPDAPSGGRLVGSIASETKNLNAIINNEATAAAFWELANCSLADRNYAHPEQFQPMLAESWEVSPDKLTFHIKLRHGVLWHDFTDPVSGKVWKDVEVTADDFKFYLDVIKNPDVDCAPIRTYLADIDRIEVIDKYEFKVIWKKRYFLAEVQTLGLQPLPRHFYHAYPGAFDGKKFNDDHRRNRVIVGCGPYRFDRWEKGQRIVFTRWEKYFGRNYGVMPKLKELVYDVIKHPNTAFQSLLAQKLDRLGLSPEQWHTRTAGPEFGPQGTLEKFRYPGLSYAYIGYNLRNPLFQDKRVRQALTMLVDRQRILKEVLFGLGRIVTGPFFIDSPYYDRSVPPYPFAPARAKAQLAALGWKDSDGDGILDKDGKKFSFTMLQVTSSTLQQKMLAIIKEDFAGAGIEMNLQSVEWSVYVQRLEQKSFDACTLMWALSFESDPYQLWHSSQADESGSSNHIGFKNREADKLIEEIRTTFELSRRIELCHRFHRLLHEEQPYTFLFSGDALVAMDRKFQNKRLFPLFGIPTAILWLPQEAQKVSLP
ncbi:MAG: peptide-binding protein [Victivallales bacterium]|nr:peptide-binding protein [Victivallales bacterium]